MRHSEYRVYQRAARRFFIDSAYLAPLKNSTLSHAAPHVISLQIDGFA